MKQIALSTDEERLVKILKALGNPIRFKMIRYMAEHPQCITGDVVEFARLAQSTVSQHLKVLRDAGLIHGEIEGTATCYCLDLEALRWFQAQMNTYSRKLEMICCP